MHEKIQQLEATVIQLFQTLVTRAEAAEARIATLEAQLAAGGATAAPAKPTSTRANTRTQTDYPTYIAVKNLVDSGISEKEVEAQLGVKYTTARAYVRWTPEQVATKKQEWDEKCAKAAQSGLPAPVPAYLQHQKTPQTVPAATGTPVVNSTPPTQSEAPVGGTVIGTVAPAVPMSEAEANYIAAREASAPGATVTDDVVDAEFTTVEPVVEPEGFAVQCPQSEGDYGLAGWFNWTMELKQYAETNHYSDGFPQYYPAARGTMVKVQYMNETYSEAVPVDSLDWTAGGGVLRWKLA